MQSPGTGSLNSSASPNVAVSPETHQVTSAYAYPDHPASDIAARNNASSGRRDYNSDPSGPSPYDHNPNDYPSPTPDRNVTPTNDYPYPSHASTNHSVGVHPAHRDNYSQPRYTEETPPRKTPTSSKKVQESPDPNFDSRFSWTTTATSTYQQSVPPSPPPPMPTFPSGRDFSESPASVKASVLDRGHPTRRLGADSPPLSSARSFSAGSTLRKPVSMLAVSTVISRYVLTRLTIPRSSLLHQSPRSSSSSFQWLTGERTIQNSALPPWRHPF